MSPSFVTWPPDSIHKHLLRQQLSAEEVRLGLPSRLERLGPSMFRIVSPGIMAFQAEPSTTAKTVGERRLLDVLGKVANGAGPEVVVKAVLDAHARGSLRPYAQNHPAMLQPGDTVLSGTAPYIVRAICDVASRAPLAAVPWFMATGDAEIQLDIAWGDITRLQDVQPSRSVVSDEHGCTIAQLRPVRRDAERMWRQAQWRMGTSLAGADGGLTQMRAASQMLSAVDAMLVNAASHRSGAVAGGPEGAFGDRRRSLQVRERQLWREMTAQSSMLAPDGFRDSTELWSGLRDERVEVHAALREMNERRRAMRSDASGTLSSAL